LQKPVMASAMLASQTDRCIVNLDAIPDAARATPCAAHELQVQAATRHTTVTLAAARERRQAC